jgi:putative polyhydroxyalkanoate system protein
MADIHIHRPHTLGLESARHIARQWVEQAEQGFGMACTYQPGAAADTVGFSRSGVTGNLQVTADGFVLDAKLGFLLGAYKERIEAEIVKNLDSLMQAHGQGAACA